MNWEIFETVVAIVGFLAVIVPPIIKLTSAITKLTITMETFGKQRQEDQKNAYDTHKRILDHNEKQDKILEDHERRICAVEIKTEDIKK